MQWRERFLIDPEPAVGPTRLGDAGVEPAPQPPAPAGPRRASLMCVLLAGTETMTTCFTMVLLALTGLIGAIRRREPAQLLVSGAARSACWPSTFLVLLYPTLNYVRTYGTNELAARRQVTEQERYGLKISRMVLPDPAHRNATLRPSSGSVRRKTPRSPREGGPDARPSSAPSASSAALYRLITHGWGRPRRAPARAPAAHDRSACSTTARSSSSWRPCSGTIGGFAILLSLARLLAGAGVEPDRR